MEKGEKAEEMHKHKEYQREWNVFLAGTMTSLVWLKHRICTCVGLEREELTEVS